MPDLSNIDRAIDSMLGLEDNETSSSTDVTASTETENGTQQGTPPQPAQTNAGGQDNEQTVTNGQNQPVNRTGSGQQPSSQQPPNTQQRNGQQGRQPPQPPRGRYPADDQGNLIDQDGNIIARAGRERQLFEVARNVGTQLERAQRTVQQYEQQLGQYQAQLEAYQNNNQLMRDLNLTPADATNALQFIAHYRSDPVAAIKNLLTEAQAAGYNIEGIGGGTDVAAIRQMINRAVQPLVQDRQQTQELTVAQQNAEREIEEVTADHPWLPLHEQTIVGILNAAPQMSLREAALRFENYAIRNGIDLDQPLDEQINRATPRQPVQQAPARVTAPNPARQPGPNASDASGIMPRATSPMNGVRSTRDIVREAFREVGVNVDHL